MKEINTNSLFNHLTSGTLPPVESWDPPYCGEIDIKIHRDGRWSYNDSYFSRTSLVKLFSTVLKREQDNYFLVTPVEKVKIQVEAEAFITKNFETDDSNKSIAFVTSLDEIVIAGTDHTITVVDDDKGYPYPTIHIRNNLHALICRSDFYRLIEIATCENLQSTDRSQCFIESGGCKFILGCY